MNKKIKIILSTLLLGLMMGYAALYFWAKNSFINTYQEAKHQLQSEGWTVEDSTLTFSGFPFHLTAHQEKLKATKQRDGLEMTIEALGPIKLYVSIFNPLKYNMEGAILVTNTFNGTPFIKGSFEKGSLKLSHQDHKLEMTSLVIQNAKAELFTPQDSTTLMAQIQEISYTEINHSLQEHAEGKVIQGSHEIALKAINVSSAKDGVSTPVLQLKKVILHAKGKMPIVVAEYLKSILKDPASSPVVQICQAGGKVPHLKATINFMEKIGSFGKIDLEVEHNNYTINADLDAKIIKGVPDLLLTTQVNNLKGFFDALNLDATVRFIANGFVKKESEKSEKGKLIMKFSQGTLFVNDTEILKVPMPDWDNILLSADVCRKYLGTVATKAAA